MSDRPLWEVSVPLWELDMEDRKLGDRRLRDIKPGSKFFLGDLLFKVMDVTTNEPARKDAGTLSAAGRRGS